MTPAQWLTDGLGGGWRGGFGSARCPGHEDKRPSLSIRDGNEAPLLKCHAGCHSDAIVDVLRRRGLWPVPVELSGRRQDRCRDTSAWALQIWRDARPIADTIAELYLRNRGITISLPPSLRYHRAIKNKNTGLLLPALIAGISGADRHIVAIQRTFLKADGSGKAMVSEPKMGLGSYTDGAVRLAAAEIELGIAEGIESALSAMQLFKIPVWAALGSERLAKLKLPADVARVTIFGDNGAPGRAAAMKAVEAYTRQRRKVTLRLPPPDFGDFNDVLCGRRGAA